MNTVGKQGRLGEQIRCVVSVSMLTEGWDANTVTHVLGVRAFGTQLLCEQVVGRALRRQSYELNEEGLFNVEYRSEEHTSELQSLMRISYAVFCLKHKNKRSEHMNTDMTKKLTM